METAHEEAPRPKHVLIVDDDRDVCETFQDILELEGYAVSVAHSGHQALELARGCHPDVVLMDIKMPVMDGVETYRHLQKGCPDIPVIMISAYAMQDRIEEALRIGAYAALRKPVRVKEFLELIAAALAAR